MDETTSGLEALREDTLRRVGEESIEHFGEIDEALWDNKDFLVTLISKYDKIEWLQSFPSHLKADKDVIFAVRERLQARLAAQTLKTVELRRQQSLEAPTAKLVVARLPTFPNFFCALAASGLLVSHDDQDQTDEQIKAAVKDLALAACEVQKANFNLLPEPIQRDRDFARLASMP